MPRPTERELKSPAWWTANARKDARYFDLDQLVFWCDEGYWDPLGAFRKTPFVPNPLRFVSRPDSAPSELPAVGTTQDSAYEINCIKPEPQNWEVLAHREGEAVVFVASSGGHSQCEVYMVPPRYFVPKKDKRPLPEQLFEAIEMVFPGANDDNLTEAVGMLQERFNVQLKD